MTSVAQVWVWLSRLLVQPVVLDSRFRYTQRCLEELVTPSLAVVHSGQVTLSTSILEFLCVFLPSLVSVGFQDGAGVAPPTTMRTPKLAGLLLFVGALLAYLILVKRHGAAARPQAFGPPPQWRPVVSWVTTTAATTARSQYCVMFDAGSMGTRVHIIQFRMDPRGSTT